jgi:Glu-tRNA(Gln) amidotransferase subunit E-like FAD-binding protein
MNNYEKIGFRCGVEIHNRLATKQKLFCSCPPRFSGDEHCCSITRQQRSVVGERGKKDQAAEFEHGKKKDFHYVCYDKETCLVDTDSEPPRRINQEALMIAFQIAKIFKCVIPDEIHGMRKTVVDGSNTSSFQRTLLIGMNGEMETSKGMVSIENVCLEEESAGIVEKTSNQSVYRLDRIGIPLVEVSTGTDIKDPEHAKEVAKKIGMIIRSTGKSQRGLGVTRQDVNVSIKGGARVEVKGVQDLDAIPEVVENEIERQQKLVLAGESKEETRVLRKDGSTMYTRPLPGGERMYPDTDLPVIVVDKKMVGKIKLPESWEEKEKRIGKLLSEDLTKQILHSEELDRWELLSKNFDAKLVAVTLMSTVRDLRRNGVNTEVLGNKHYQDVFFVLGKGLISKEVVGDVLEAYSKNPKKAIGEIVAGLGIENMNDQELRTIVKDVIRRNPKLVEGKNIGGLMGDVMKEVRGKVDGGKVKQVLDEVLGENLG